jgi:hypothetical protein
MKHSRLNQHTESFIMFIISRVSVRTLRGKGQTGDQYPKIKKLRTAHRRRSSKAKSI